MRKIGLFLLFLFLLFFSIVNTGFSLGIGPTDNEVDFQPNLVYEKTFYVVNSENYNIPIKMLVEGELSEYMTLDRYDFILGPKTTGSGLQHVKLKLTLPESLERPGAHRNFICAMENFEAVTSGISARIKSCVSLTVYVPYPGKYVEFTVRIENPEVNKTIRFFVDAINRGNETIKNALFRFYVYDADNNLVTSLVTEGKRMEPNEKVNFVGEWLAKDVRPGRYKLVTRVEYDDYRREDTTEFLIGSPTAKIVNISASDIVKKSEDKVTARFVEGSIARIIARVASEWNDKLTGLYILLTIKKDAFSTSVKSETFDLAKWEERDVTLFWDTSESPGPGEYTGYAVLYYPNGTHNVTFSIEVKSKLSDLLMPLVIIIIIAVILAYVFHRRRGKKVVQKKLF